MPLNSKSRAPTLPARITSSSRAATDRCDDATKVRCVVTSPSMVMEIQESSRALIDTKNDPLAGAEGEDWGGTTEVGGAMEDDWSPAGVETAA